MIEEKQLPVEELRKGMYVSRLDRPWTETPFLFQGFNISRAREIEILRDYCDYVFIDVDRTRQSLLEVQAEPDPDLIAPLPRPVEHYQNECTVQEELGSAQQTLEGVSDTVRELLQGFRQGRSMSLPVAGRAVESLVASMLRNPDAMMLLQQLRSRDEYAYSHSIGAGVLAVAFARHMGFSRRQIKFFATGALLMDIGKLRVPADILRKPGRLSEAEIADIRRHVEYGLELLEGSQGVAEVTREVVACHHERFDGTGYPRGLKGRHIPVHARMAAIIDAYDAMTSDRAYAPAVSPQEAIHRLYALGGSEYQKELVEQFIQCIGAYPTGTLVELSTGEVGIVVAQNRVRRLRPTVMLVLGPDKCMLEEPSTLDLMESATDDGIEPVHIAKAHPPGAFGIRPEEYYL